MQLTNNPAALIKRMCVYWIVIKQKSPSLPRSLALGTFLRIANRFLDQGKYAIPPLFNLQVVLSSAPDKAKLFARNFY